VTTAQKTHVGQFEENTKKLGKWSLPILAGYALNKLDLIHFQLTFETGILSFLGVAISIVGLYIWQIGKDIKEIRQQLNDIERRLPDEHE